jgi:hypothetical protein
MAIEPDAFTTGLWRFDEPSNQGPLSQGSISGSGTTGYRARFYQSGVPGCEFSSINGGMHATVSDPSNLLRFERTQPMSLSVWGNFTGSGGGAATTFNGTWFGNVAVTTGRGFRFGISLARRLKMQFLNTATTNELTVRANNLFDDGRVHHVVFVYDGSSAPGGCQIWVDGVSQALTTEINNLAATIVSTGTLCLGRSGSLASGAEHEGVAGNFAFFNTNISPATIAALFALGPDTPVPPQANLVATWRCDRTDNYTTSGGILDRASGALGTFNATAVNGLAPYVAFNGQITAGRAPAYSVGPRRAQNLGFDVSRWMTPLASLGNNSTNYLDANAFGTSGSLQTRGWAMRTFLGDAYTVEGWLFIDRSGSTQLLFGCDSNSTGQQNFITLNVLSTMGLQVTWNTTTPRTFNSAAGILPLKSWFHFCMTCVRVTTTYTITIYVNAVAVATTSLTAPAAFTDTNGNSSRMFVGYNITSNSNPFFGGMAYWRVSKRARTLLEIQAATADPATIVNDADTYFLWHFQDSQQIKDESIWGHHLLPQGAYVGNASGWNDAPFDGYGVTGPTFNDLAHQFINVNANSARHAMVRQEAVDTWTGQNEATFEQFIRMDQNLSRHRLLAIGGDATSNVVASNRVMVIDLQTDQTLRAFWEGAGGFGYLLRSTNPVISQEATQSGEFGKFYALAVRKRAVGNRNYWQLNGTTQWVSMGTPAALAFERTNAFSLVIRVSRLSGIAAIESLIGKMNNVGGQGYMLQFDSSGRADFRLDNGAGQVLERRGATVITDGFEHQIVVTYDGTSTAAGLLIYVDGVVQSMTTVTATLASGSILNAGAFAIGARNGASLFLNGLVREAAAYNRVLTAAEVLATYGFTGGPPPNLMALASAADLRGWWRFNQADTASTIFDNSAAGINGTPQASLAPTVRGSCVIDFAVNGVVVESGVGPMPEPTVGDIYTATGSLYSLQMRDGTETETRGIARMSNKARSDEELLEFFQQETGVPEPPTLSVEIVSPLPVGSVVDTDEPIVCLVRSSSAFVRIMLLMNYPGFPFTEAAYTQNPASVDGRNFEPLFSGSSVSLVSDPELFVYRFELRRSTPWPGSPRLQAYAFAGGAEV